MALVTESGGQRNIRESRTPNHKMPAGELDPLHANVVADGAIKLLSKFPRQVNRVPADGLGYYIEFDRIREVLIDEVSCPEEPPRWSSIYLIESSCELGHQIESQSFDCQS